MPPGAKALLLTAAVVWAHRIEQGGPEIAMVEVHASGRASDLGATTRSSGRGAGERLKQQEEQQSQQVEVNEHDEQQQSQHDELHEHDEHQQSHYYNHTRITELEHENEKLRAQSRIAELELENERLRHGSQSSSVSSSLVTTQATDHTSLYAPEITCQERVEQLKKLRREFNGTFYEAPIWVQFNCAAVLSAVGLASNSVVTLIGAMLISPLMTPILQLTYAIADTNDGVQDSILRATGQFAWCFLLAFSIGVMSSLFCHAVRFDRLYEWPTKEMMGRCELRNCIAGIGVAICSGIAISTALDLQHTEGRGFGNDVVGVAIAASLLPPLVNTGMLSTAVAFHWYDAKKNPDAEEAEDKDWIWSTKLDYAHAGISALLTMINVTGVICSAVIMFKINLRKHFACEQELMGR